MSIKNAGPVIPNNMASHMAQYPKHGSFGTLIPNRIFVGGIASDVSIQHDFSILSVANGLDLAVLLVGLH